MGRVLFGFVLDRVAQRRAAAVSFLNQVWAIGVLAWASEPCLVYGACAAYGLSVGNNITFQPLIVSREYPPAAFAGLVALTTTVTQIAYAFGPGLLGLLRDATGGYDVPLGVCAGLLAAAAAWVAQGGGRKETD